jgi:hypothetical protein
MPAILLSKSPLAAILDFPKIPYFTSIIREIVCCEIKVEIRYINNKLTITELHSC